MKKKALTKKHNEKTGNQQKEEELLDDTCFTVACLDEFLDEEGLLVVLTPSQYLDMHDAASGNSQYDSPETIACLVTDDVRHDMKKYFAHKSKRTEQRRTRTR